MTNEKHIGCGYLKSVTTQKNWRKSITRLLKGIRESSLDFDSVVFAGMSGALVAPTIAGRLRKSILMVRKAGDQNHGGYRLEGNPDTRNYIIIDDLIASGDTIRHMMKTIKANDFTRDAKCVGIFLYNSQRNETFEGVPVKGFYF